MCMISIASHHTMTIMALLLATTIVYKFLVKAFLKVTITCSIQTTLLKLIHNYDHKLQFV